MAGRLFEHTHFEMIEIFFDSSVETFLQFVKLEESKILIAAQQSSLPQHRRQNVRVVKLQASRLNNRVFITELHDHTSNEFDHLGPIPISSMHVATGA